MFTFGSASLAWVAVGLLTPSDLMAVASASTSRTGSDSISRMAGTYSVGPDGEHSTPVDREGITPTRAHFLAVATKLSITPVEATATLDIGVLGAMRADRRFRLRYQSLDALSSPRTFRIKLHSSRNLQPFRLQHAVDPGYRLSKSDDGYVSRSRRITWNLDRNAYEAVGGQRRSGATSTGARRPRLIDKTSRVTQRWPRPAWLDHVPAMRDRKLPASFERLRARLRELHGTRNGDRPYIRLEGDDRATLFRTESLVERNSFRVITSAY